MVTRRCFQGRVCSPASHNVSCLPASPLAGEKPERRRVSVFSSRLTQRESEKAGLQLKIKPTEKTPCHAPTPLPSYIYAEAIGSYALGYSVSYSRRVHSLF